MPQSKAYYQGQFQMINIPPRSMVAPFNGFKFLKVQRVNAITITVYDSSIFLPLMITVEIINTSGINVMIDPITEYVLMLFSFRLLVSMKY
jgi:hypothetical protein